MYLTPISALFSGSALRTSRLTFVMLALFVASGCAESDAPPEVSLGGSIDKRFEVGEIIPLIFSEPIVAESLSLSIWPGEKSAYDIEGAVLPETKPLLDGCTLATSPCGESGGVILTLDAERTTASLDIAAGALGEVGRPLIIDIAGSLEDDAGNKKNVSQRLSFQIVAPEVDIGDVTGGDGDGEGPASLPDDVVEGGFLFFVEFSFPIALPQQFFIDMQINKTTGTFIAIATDADPDTAAGAQKNTSIPDELFMDLGPEGFVFTFMGQIVENEEGALIFESEPFTVSLKVGPISFALRDSVVKGRVGVDEVTGLGRWDGLMSVSELYYNPGPTEATAKIYVEEDGLVPESFQLVELLETEYPEDMPRVCEDDPCPPDVQACDLLEGVAWPPAAVCDEE